MYGASRQPHLIVRFHSDMDGLAGFNAPSVGVAHHRFPPSSFTRWVWRSKKSTADRSPARPRDICGICARAWLPPAAHRSR